MRVPQTLALSASVGLLAAAQDFDSSTCAPGGFDATGSAPILLAETTDPLYVTFGINDTRSGTSGWLANRNLLSAPASLNNSLTEPLQGCIYDFAGVNRSSTMDPAAGNTTFGASCQGVLSEACVAFFESATASAGPGQDLCPELNRTAMVEACGEDADGYNTFSLGDITSPECDYPSDGLAVPPSPDYITKLYGGIDYGRHSFESTDPWMIYDLLVRQSFPRFVQLVSSGENGNTHSSSWSLVCITPENITEGSRVPEREEFPSEASLVRGVAGWSTALVVAVGMMMV